MTTLANNTQTYAVVAAKRCTPHIQTQENNAKIHAAVAAKERTPHAQVQRATGRSKAIRCSTTADVGAVKSTTDIQSHQGTTGSPTGIAKAQMMQPESDAKTMLRKALYEIFGVKEKPVTKKAKENPIEVNAICYSGGRYGTSLGTQPRNMPQTKYKGHKRAPPPNKLMRSKECFHCHKKGHYA